MDLKQISTEETHFDEPVKVVLYDAAGQPEQDSKGGPVSVSVVSIYSRAGRKNAQAQKQAIAKLARRYGGFDAIPQDELDALDDKAVAVLLTAWEGFESDGAPFPLTIENAQAVVSGLRMHRPKQLAQIEGAIAQHAGFFTTASAS